MVGQARLQAADARADGLRGGAVGGRQCHARGIAVGGGQSVFKLRRGGGIVRIHRAVERRAGGGIPDGVGGGDDRRCHRVAHALDLTRIQTGCPRPGLEHAGVGHLHPAA